MLARLFRAGELSAIYVPEADDEAIRDLAQARADILRARQKARQQLQALLLRSGKRYPRKCVWTLAHRRWLCDLRLDHPAQKIALEEYLAIIDEATHRIERVETALAEQTSTWRMAPVIEALQALKGVRLLTAITLVTELGDLSRFDKPRQLMAFLGLVPSENLERRTSPSRRHHQGRQHARPQGTHRGSMGLQASGTHRSPPANAQRNSTHVHSRHRLEGATAAHFALPKALGTNEATHRRHYGTRSRTRRICLGDRSPPAHRFLRLSTHR